MTKLNTISGASVCVVALCFGLSVSVAYANTTSKTQTEAGALTGEVLGVAKDVSGVTDKVGLTSSTGLSGIANSINSNAETVINAVDGGANILSGSGGSIDLGNMAVGYGKVFEDANVTQIGSAVKNVANLKSLSDLTNLNNLGDVGTSFLKDMSPEIKQLMSMSFDDLGLSSMLGGFGGGGYPVLMPTNVAQSTASVATSQAQTAQTEGLLSSETDLTASFGPVGNMDGRMGQCVVNSEDYSQPISYWLQAVGPKLEGTCPWLYLDTYCWPTIGVGTLLGKDLKTMYQTFMPMEYVDANGNLLDKKTQEEDLRKIYNLHLECRSKLNSDPEGAKKIYNYVCGGNHWKNMFNGRRISDASMQAASFDEICKDHAKSWANYWKQLGKSYTQLPLLHQVFVVDVSYQAGAGAIKGNNRAYLPNRTPVWQNLAAGNCSGAASAFSSQRLCTEFSARCQQRKAMITQGCAGY